MPVVGVDRNVEEGASEVDNAEDLGTVDLPSKILQEGEGVGVNHSHLVQGTEVGTRPSSAPWFWG